MILSSFSKSFKSFSKIQHNKHKFYSTMNKNMMKAICLKEFGGVDQMYIGEVEKPTPKPNEVLVKIKACGVNRADIIQRKGFYPPPKGESEILGLEMAGVIEELGENVSQWNIGDKVMALLPGGGYAEYCTVPSSLIMRIPKGLSFSEAAALPETYLTCYQALFWVGDFKENQDILIHGGASGIGTSAIQLAKTLKNTNVIITAGSEEKCNFCKSLGADITINYKEENFKEKVLKSSRKGGVDFVLDFIGKNYFQHNIDVLREDGTMVLLAMLSGSKVDNINIAPILFKRLSIKGTTLRARSLEYKTKLVEEFSEKFLPMFETGELKVIVDKEFSWQQSPEAHTYMEENKNKGKIVLTGM